MPAAQGLPEDSGRAEGARLVLADEFNCLGAYRDADPQSCTELRFMAAPGDEAERAFKTPSLRGASARAPYMHAGQFASLPEVQENYPQHPRHLRGTANCAPSRSAMPNGGN
ncbi:MAG: hypothetical protein KDK26_10260 [Roseivivax sp.]|nr:hypothetical protein [Roseivivax sp.]